MTKAKGRDEMSTGGIPDKARAILAQRRQYAQITADRHMKEINDKIPEIARLKAELADTGSELVRTVLANPHNIEAAVGSLKDKSLALQEKIKELLIKNGYPEDYLKEKYFCPYCDDTGYVGSRKCVCFTRLVKQLSAEEMNRRSPLELCDFQTFRLDYYPDTAGQEGISPRKQMERVYQYCVRYAEGFSLKSASLFLFGGTGLGKTHLSLAIAHAVLDKGYHVIYGSAQDLFRQVEREHFGRDAADKDTLQNLLDCDLLVLDDLGAEFESGYYTACLYNIVNSRINAQRPTIISSNLDSEQIQQRYPERIVSRLLAVYQSLRFMGKDIRQLKAAGQ